MLLDHYGHFNGDQLSNFRALLEAAGKCGFVVDVTINREGPLISVLDITGNSTDARCMGGQGTTGIPEIVCAIRSPLYSHVFIDLQNEMDQGADKELTPEQVQAISQHVHTIDPTRIVMASHSSGVVDPSVTLAGSANLDVVAYHQRQTADWYEYARGEVNALKAAARPVYFQEGARATYTWDPYFRGVDCSLAYEDGNPFVKAATAAKLAGAAAWTFHTGAGMRLHQTPFTTALCAPELVFLDAVSTHPLDHVGWSTLGDHDWDGMDDFVVWRPTAEKWFGKLSGSLGTLREVAFGSHDDTPVQADYDGDGIADLAVYSFGEDDIFGQWDILCSTDGGPSHLHLGNRDDVPVPFDFNGDGRVDVVVWSPAGHWSAMPSVSGCNFSGQVDLWWDQNDLVLIPGDYDGDGKTDPAYFQRSTHTWHVLLSRNGYDEFTYHDFPYIADGDTPVAGDFTGDGRFDFAVFRPSTTQWAWVSWAHPEQGLAGWFDGGSSPGDVVVPGDYDGDGKIDPAVWRPTDGGWYVSRSSLAQPGQSYPAFFKMATMGEPKDTPLPGNGQPVTVR